MKIMRVLLCCAFMGNALVGMVLSHDPNDPLTWPRLKKTNEGIEQLKKAVFEKADPKVVQKLINEIKATSVNPKSRLNPNEAYYMWHDIFEPNKAALVGNAESAARVVDVQVQNLAKRGKAIPADLQMQHGNARTNIHLVKDFLYPLEKEIKFLSDLQPAPNVEAARNK